MRAAALLLALAAAPVAADSPADLAQACGGFRADMVLLPLESETEVSLAATQAAAEVLSDRLPGPRLFGRSLTSEVEVTGPGQLTIWRAGPGGFGIEPEVLFTTGGPMAVYDVVAFDRPAQDGELALPYRDGETVVVPQEPVMAALRVEEAEATFDQSNSPAVQIRLTADAGLQFGVVTADRLGQPMALVHDGRVLTAPTIQSPILGGSLIITGLFTMEEAETLTAMLNSGAFDRDVSIEMTVALSGTGDASCNEIISGTGDAAD